MEGIPPIKKQLLQSNKSLPPVFIPNELISLILSFLSVKTLTQLRCASKSWNTLISDPTFIKFHLKKSSQNHHLITHFPYRESSVLSMHCFLENQSIGVAFTHLRCPIISEFTLVVGSCNGLIFLLCRPCLVTHFKYWLYVWNPATRTISDKLGFLRDYRDRTFVFSVGCDYLTGTYKVVALHIEKNKEQEIENKGLWRSKVKVFNLGDNCWRNIQSFPFVPILGNDGAHYSGTINWLAIHSDYAPIEVGGTYKTPIGPVEKCVIVSLDLSTETYTQFLLPEGFKDLPCINPSLRVLMDCLCFLYDYKRTELVIWQMKEFGVQESWTQLFRIEYVNLQLHTWNSSDTLVPLHLSKNGDTLIFTTEIDKKLFIYNQRDKTVEKTITYGRVRWTSAIEYVESLVPTPWKSADIKKRKSIG